VHAYCLTPDQYHLLVRTPRANLSRAMRQLNGVFTQRCNTRFAGKGHLFRVVTRRCWLIRQISGRNGAVYPFAAEETGDAKKADQYPWSSARAYLGSAKAPAWLFTKALAKANGHTIASFTKQAWMRRPHISTAASIWMRYVAIRRSARKPRDGRQYGEKAQDWHQRAGIAVICKQVADAFRVDPSHLQVSLRGRSQGNLPRQVAMALARSPGGYSLTQIAKTLKVGHYSSVSVAATRLKKKLERR